MAAAATPRATRAPLDLPLIAIGGGIAALLALVLGAVALRSPVLGFGLATAVAVVAVLARPELAVPAAVLLLYTNAPGVAVATQDLPTAVAVAIPFMLLLPAAQARLQGAKPVMTWPLVILVALLGLACVSTLAGAFPERATPELIDMAVDLVALYALLIHSIRNKAAFELAVWSVIAAAAFLAALAVTQRLGGLLDQQFGGFAFIDGAYFTGHNPDPRARGPVDDPNYFAQLLLPALALAIALMSAKRGILRLGATAAALVIVGGIALTYSRGGALALVVMFVALAALRLVRGQHVALIGLLVVTVLSVDPGYRERILSLAQISGASEQVGSSEAADLAAQSRLTENAAAILIWRDHPVIGAGLESYPPLYQTYAPKAGPVVYTEGQGAEPGEAPEREAHNLFLGIAAELGLLGLGLLCALFAAAWAGLARARRAFQDRDRTMWALAGGFSAGLVGYAVAGLFLSLAFERYLGVLLGLAGALTLLIPRDEGPPHRNGPGGRTSEGPRSPEPDHEAFPSGLA